MNQMTLGEYKEKKPHLWLLVVWRVIERIVPLTPNYIRIAILRLFGAKIGKHCLMCRTARFYVPWNFECGDYVCIGPGTNVYCKDKVVVGSQVVISQDSYLCTASHDVSSPALKLVTKPISVGDNVWIAAKVVVLPGVRIGDGAVLGCASVVPKDIPQWKIAVGNPARVIKERIIHAN